jgi:hypothetical protein
LYLSANPKNAVLGHALICGVLVTGAPGQTTPFQLGVTIFSQAVRSDVAWTTGITYSAAGIASIAASSATIPTFAKPRLSNFPSHLASLPIPDPYKDRVFLDLFQTLESERQKPVFSR